MNDKTSEAEFGDLRLERVGAEAADDAGGILEFGGLAERRDLALEEFSHRLVGDKDGFGLGVGRHGREISGRGGSWP